MTPSLPFDFAPLKNLVVRDTLEINLLGLATIPVLAFIGPRVLQNDADGCRVKIPLNYRTKNHMNSMYFGVLTAGADVASGIPVVKMMREKQKPVVPSFKDLHAEFLKRVEGDCVFENMDIPAIAEAYEETIRTGERVNLAVHIMATVPEKDPNEVVAKFTTTLSMRYRPDQKMSWMQSLLWKL